MQGCRSSCSRLSSSPEQTDPETSPRPPSGGRPEAHGAPRKNKKIEKMLGMSAGKFSFFLTKVGKKYIIVNGNKSKQGDIAMNKKSVTDVDVNGKRVLVRCDFNVPMKDGKITDENRIMGALPTIKYLMEHNAKIVLCSHMGKPHNIFDAKVKLNKKEKKAVEAPRRMNRPRRRKNISPKRRRTIPLNLL